MQAISYLGYHFEVPQSWSVFNDVRHPATCVRFDTHAVYLGAPGANENCPSWLLGVTEAILIQPASASSPRRTVENQVDDTITATAPGIEVTATFGTDPAMIGQILASAGLDAPGPAQPGTAAPGAGGAAAAVGAVPMKTQSAQSHYSAPALLPASVTNDIGLGFDTCTAPSAQVMRAWRRHSPYRAVGIYIGGSERACAQPNLTRGWVRARAAAGWRFIPMYVGPQADFGQLTSPGRQGKAAAADAVRQARRLGFGPFTPLYYDMEAFPPRYNQATLRFLSAWTQELHRLGYRSGIYSSSDSGIAELASHYYTRGIKMPNVIYDALWNGSVNVADAVYRHGEWEGHRLHQFSGNALQSYGGARMEIDQDYLRVTIGDPPGTRQAAAATVTVNGGAVVFYQGADGGLWEGIRTKSGQWERLSLGGQLSSQPTVVRSPGGELDVFYRDSKQMLTVTRQVGGRWLRPQQLTMMGAMGGAPQALAQGNGVIDVFWEGPHGKSLWQADYNPGGGWSGPHRLSGNLASQPTVVEAVGGVPEVFWEGRHGKLWRVMRPVGSPWTKPQDLGMGPMGGAPEAVALTSGQVDVFWPGSTAAHHVWAAFIAGSRVHGPVDLGGAVTGGNLVAGPWPVAAGSAVEVFFRGTDNQMWVLSQSGGHWSGPVAAAKFSGLTSAPYAVGAGTGGKVWVYWDGPDGQVWTAQYATSGGWQPPLDLGGTGIGSVGCVAG